MNARPVVLLIESRREHRNVRAAPGLAKILAREGYVTRRVPDAGPVLHHAIEREEPDLLFWSAAPDEAWAERLRALKAQVEPSFLPVILLAPGDDREARVAGLRAGADDVLPSAWLQEDEVLARAAALLRIKAREDALRKAKDEAERQSVTDALTGLFNRRYFAYRLQQELERGRRYAEPVSLLVIDLDHFKRVNDRYGHRVGDEALRLSAQLLQRQVRQVDVCTRWGGEELAVIMPNTAGSGALVVGRRVLHAFRAEAVLQAVPAAQPGAAPEPLALTASLGLATCLDGSEDGESLLARADAAVYQAKAAGRDGLCVAPIGRRDHVGAGPASLFMPVAALR